MSAVVRDRRGHVEILTINRPEARNAINGEVSRLLAKAFDELADDPECRVVILTGAGDRAFCAGMDLHAYLEDGKDSVVAEGGFAAISERDFPKPIVAAINGPAVAGGFEITLACDVVVAADHATFGIPEVKRGLLAGAGGLFRLPRRLPLSIALELAMTGEVIDASRAFSLGLVNGVVPREQLIDESLRLANAIAANAPLAVQWSRQVMLDTVGMSDGEAWAVNDEGIDKVFASSDAKEGPAAFLEKREPVWRGR